MRVPVLILLGVLFTGCGTVDLGDNIVPPDLQVDDDVFYCVIQPQVIAQYRCASGQTTDGGGCHVARSSLRFSFLGESDTPPMCDADNNVLGTIPDSYRMNLDAVRAVIQSDPLSSPFYRRPIGLDAHPRVIFPDTDPAAILIFDWLTAGAS